MPAFKEFYLTEGVSPIPGEPCRYHVASRNPIRSKVKSYLVDLEDCGFNGACGCDDFKFNHLPKLKQDRREQRPPRKRRCWHIKQALLFHGEITVRLIVRHYYQPRTKTNDNDETRPTQTESDGVNQERPRGHERPTGENTGKSGRTTGRAYQLDRSRSFGPRKEG